MLKAILVVTFPVKTIKSVQRSIKAKMKLLSSQERRATFIISRNSSTFTRSLSLNTEKDRVSNKQMVKTIKCLTMHHLTPKEKIKPITKRPMESSMSKNTKLPRALPTQGSSSSERKKAVESRSGLTGLDMKVTGRKIKLTEKVPCFTPMEIFTLESGVTIKHTDTANMSTQMEQYT
jgi:hypothetical protein